MASRDSGKSSGKPEHQQQREWWAGTGYPKQESPLRGTLGLGLAQLDCRDFCNTWDFRAQLYLTPVERRGTGVHTLWGKSGAGTLPEVGMKKPGCQAFPPEPLSPCPWAVLVEHRAPIPRGGPGSKQKPEVAAAVCLAGTTSYLALRWVSAKAQGNWGSGDEGS